MGLGVVTIDGYVDGGIKIDGASVHIHCKEYDKETILQ